MKKLFLALLFLTLLCSTVYALSPEIRSDMLKTKLGQQLKAKDYKAALKTMEEIKELGSTLPKSFSFFEGKALFESGQKAEAYKKLESYVTSQGKTAKHYTKAIAYMVKAEEAHLAQIEADREAAKKAEARRKQLEEEKWKENQEKLRLEFEAIEFNSQSLAVHHESTGLMWTIPVDDKFDKYNPNPYLKLKHSGTESEAKGFCSDLDLYGYQDWRVPSMKEFTTVMPKNPKSPLDWEKFKYINVGKFWLRGNKEFSVSRQSSKSFNDKLFYLVSLPYFTESGSSEGRILCVRTESQDALNNFFNRKHSIVKHKGNTIMVEDRYMVDSNMCYVNDPYLKYDRARKYCNDTTLGGYDDWRVPTVEDVKNKIHANVINDLWFMGTRSELRKIWAVDKSGLFLATPYYFDGNKGKYGKARKGDEFRVRCIRDVPPDN